MVQFSIFPIAFLLRNKYRAESGHHGGFSNSRAERREGSSALHAHVAVVSPIVPSILHRRDLKHSNYVVSRSKSQLKGGAGGTADSNISSETLRDLCSSIGVESYDNLRLESTPDGVRGVYVNEDVKEGQPVLKVPLSSCLRDDEPPEWMSGKMKGDTYFNYNPSEWATRLAASLLDLQLKFNIDRSDDNDEGTAMWLEMLPESNFLRASLPVHWSEEMLRSASCSALELAVDSSYFARAEAVADLMEGLENCNAADNFTPEKLRRMCENALDVIQTRSCRVQAASCDSRLEAPLRILAPVFDFINHGSNNYQGDGGANTCFSLEIDESGDEEVGSALVVRATKDIEANDEVLFDYGDSARPAWKSLLSYGFVPQYKNSQQQDSDDSQDQEEYDEENIAEVYMDGVRYEVGPSSIPTEMVAASATSLIADTASLTNRQELDDAIARAEEEGSQPVALTPDIAKRISSRMYRMAFQLLVDPDLDINFEEDENELELEQLKRSPEDVISAQLAASLRWAQNRILMACAKGLHEFAQACEAQQNQQQEQQQAEPVEDK